MPLPPYELFAEIYRIHGHRCPMSTLGGRLGFAASARLVGQKPLIATYYIDTCAADGISVITGCKKVDGTLRIIAQGRHALWLESAKGDGIFAELKSQTLKLACDYRDLDLAFQKDESSLSSEERQLRQAAKMEVFEDLLEKFRTLPEDELIGFATELPVDLVRTAN